MSKPVAYPLAVYSILPSEPVTVPPEWRNVVSPELYGLFQFAQTLSIRQHVKILPKACFTCPPCAPQEQTFSVYAGMNQDDQAEILRVDEVSNDWNRCCCHPFHPLRLEVRQYIPIPGDNSTTDYGHISQDFNEDWARLTGADQYQRLTQLYKSTPPIFTIVRDDGQRCCALPCKCLSTFVCCHCCQDGMHVYSGSLEGKDTDPKELGRHKDLPTTNLLGSVIQPVYGGWCWPTLEVRGEREEESAIPYGKIVGPMFFGGCIDLCCDFKFYTSRATSARHEGDLAMITRKKPASTAAVLREFMTDADAYNIEFNPDAKLTGSQKVTILAGQLLVDYMVFSGQAKTKCDCDQDNCYIYICYCMCIGNICPCTITIPWRSMLESLIKN